MVPRSSSARFSVLVLCLATLVMLAPLGPFAPSTDAASNLDVPETGLPTLTRVTGSAGLGGFLHAGYLGPGAGGGNEPAYFTEAMGPGACWLDHDQDGDLDLYLVNGIYQTHPEKNALLDPHSMLFSNDGDGTFTDVTDAAGARTSGSLQGCAAADYDNDGYPDLFVSGWGGSHLLHNDGDGTFTEVTASAGVADVQCGEYLCWASSATWLDADRDGCLDLFVAHFTDYDPAENLPFNAPGPGQVNRFFKGNCAGVFTDATAAAGLDLFKHDSWATASGDLNNDGWPDLYIADDGDPNELFLNDGDGSFTHRHGSAALDPGSGMGVAIGDFDHNGRMDIVTTNYLSQYNGIYQAVGDDYFNIGGNEPFTDAETHSGWATHFVDINHDGHQDLIVVNGMTEDSGVVAMKQPVLAYLNLDGGTTWRSVKNDLGPDILPGFVGRGASWADYDNDGDMDFLLAEAGENPTHLFRSDRVAGNFLLVDVSSAVTGVNRDAVGTRVTMSAAGLLPQTVEKQAGSGYLGNHDPRLHFGLARAEAVDLTVRWPDGSFDTYDDVRGNSLVRIVQGVGLSTVREHPLVRPSGPVEVVQRLDAVPFSVSYDLPAGTTLAGIAWDFDDGTNASGADTVHAFTDVGAFVVRVTVTDSAGRASTQAVKVVVASPLAADLDMAKEVFLPHEPVAGTVTVTFPDGAAVPFADVTVLVQRRTGNALLDSLIENAPFFVRELGGFLPIEFSGATDAGGVFAFEVPRNLASPTGLAPFSAYHVGTYEAAANGGARGSLFDPVLDTYQVGAQAPDV